MEHTHEEISPANLALDAHHAIVGDPSTAEGEVFYNCQVCRFSVHLDPYDGLLAHDASPLDAEAMRWLAAH